MPVEPMCRSSIAGGGPAMRTVMGRRDTHASACGGVTAPQGDARPYAAVRAMQHVIIESLVWRAWDGGLLQSTPASDERRETQMGGMGEVRMNCCQV